MIELLFPRRCPVCDRVVGTTAGGICPSCKKKIKYIREPRCKKCGKGLRKEEEEYCYDCQKKEHVFSKGMALYDYKAMQDSIFRFKYQGRCEYADFYGKDIAEKLGKEIAEWNAEGLIPVPIHFSRKNQRGYNQAELIAKAMSEHLSIPVYDKLIIRCKKTVPQKELGTLERQNNLKKAFKIVEDDVKLKSIILVDDIYTTGSTIDSIAREFKKHGVDKIFYIALSIGKGMN